MSLLELCKIEACRAVSILMEWVEHMYHITCLSYHVSEPDKYSKPETCLVTFFPRVAQEVVNLQEKFRPLLGT